MKHGVDKNCMNFILNGTCGSYLRAIKIYNHYRICLWVDYFYKPFVYFKG